MLCSLAATAFGGVAHARRAPAAVTHSATHTATPADHTNFMAGLRGGKIANPKVNGFDPSGLVRDFDHGRTRRLASGRVVREWELEATEREIELAPGVKF